MLEERLVLLVTLLQTLPPPLMEEENSRSNEAMISLAYKGCNLTYGPPSNKTTF